MSGFDSAEFGDTRKPSKPQPARATPAPPAPPTAADVGGEWMTVREASEATGVPQGTLRGWHRRGRVAGRTGVGERGPRIELLASDVKALAARRREGSGQARPEPTVGSDPVETPAGVLVPLDSWQQLLRQLGNLHEAGRDLAAARERAAKAETEAIFLRERLAELRAQVAAPPPTARPPQPVAQAAPPPPVDRSAGMRVVTRLGRALRPLGRRRRR